MFGLIADIAVQKVYDMDNHMFNWIGIAITILSIVIGVITLITAIAGFFSFKNMRKEINKNKKEINKNVEKYKTEIDKSIEKYKKNIDNQNKKFKEIDELNAKLKLDLIEFQKINLHSITSNIHIVSYQIAKSKTDMEVAIGFVEIKRMIEELVRMVPDKFYDAEQYIFCLKDSATALGVISAVVAKIKKAEEEDRKIIFEEIEKLKKKVALKEGNISNISEEDEKNIRQTLDSIDKSVDKIKKEN